jgi:hypothetical protein
MIMTRQIVSHRNQEYNRILKELTDFYKDPTYKLIAHLRRIYHYTDEQIADLMGFTRQGFNNAYPKK